MTVFRSYQSRVEGNGNVHSSDIQNGPVLEVARVSDQQQFWRMKKQLQVGLTSSAAIWIKL